MPGTITKVRTGKDVLSSAIQRIEWVFDTFPAVCLSFSGGKDSTVLFHLVADVARRKKRRFSVLFIDWEAQYQCTIEHAGNVPGCNRHILLGGTSPDHGKRCLSISARVDMLGTRCDVGSSATK